MKTALFTVIGMSVLTSAFAQTQASPPYLLCAPAIRYQSEITNVLMKGPFSARLTYGSRSNSIADDFAVQKSDSSDLRFETFTGPSFQLVVDVENGTGELKAVLKGQRVELKNLICQLHEFNSHPGVTMSN